LLIAGCGKTHLQLLKRLQQPSAKLQRLRAGATGQALLDRLQLIPRTTGNLAHTEQSVSNDRRSFTYYPLCAYTLLIRRQEGHPACKNNSRTSNRQTFSSRGLAGHDQTWNNFHEHLKLVISRCKTLVQLIN